MQKISIVKGNDRKENIKKAIMLIGEDIEKAIQNKRGKSKMLFIKVNAIDINFPLACTHPDALEAVLEIFHNKFDEVIVGDNSFAFSQYGGEYYRQASSRFPNVRLSDLAEFDSESIEFETLSGTEGGKVSLLPRKAFTISLALPKTHDAFVYTGCLKNMFGCVIKNRNGLHAMKLHERMILNKYVQGNRMKWQNLANVIQKTAPDLCILDAFEGMEGEGPIMGTGVKLGAAMCSTDGLALDRMASRICGLGDVPYLKMLSERAGDPANENIKIIKEGFNDIGEISKRFKMHYNSRYQTKTELNALMPLLDFRSGISLLRRSYRLKDKIKEMFAEKSRGRKRLFF